MEFDLRKLWFWALVSGLLVIIALLARMKTRMPGATASRVTTSRLAILDFDSFVPRHPLPASRVPEATDPPLAIEDRSPVRLGALPGDLRLEFLARGAPVFTTALVVDGFPIETGYSVEQEDQTIKIAFDRDLILADGERHITVFITDSTGKVGSLTESVTIANPKTKEYFDGISQLEADLRAKLPDPADLATLEKYVAVLRIRGEFGRITKDEYKTRITAFSAGIKTSSHAFWKAVSGKSLTAFDIALLGRVFGHNWEKRLPDLLKLPGDFVTPFIARS